MSVLIGIFGSKNILWVIFLSQHWNSTKFFADVSIFEKIQNFDYFSGFCSPEFDLFMKDWVIYGLKYNEQHSSIPKSQIKTLATVS